MVAGTEEKSTLAHEGRLIYPDLLRPGDNNSDTCHMTKSSVPRYYSPIGGCLSKGQPGTVVIRDPKEIHS